MVRVRGNDMKLKRTICGLALAVIAVILLSPMASQAGGARVYGGVHVGGGVRHGYYGGYHGYRYPGYGGAGYRYWGPRYWGSSVWVGPGFWWGSPYYAYPYYASPPVVQQPPVYVEPTAPPQEPQYWYYCQNPQGYYPYVQQCPNGWMKVVPQSSPPGQ